MAESRTLEIALARAEDNVEAVLKAADAVVRELRKARSSAKSGAVRDLRRALAAAADSIENLRQSAQSLREAWTFDERAYMGSGGYTHELVEAAKKDGLRLYGEDRRIIGYPSVIRLLPEDAALEIDRKRERRLRPSWVVGRLRELQGRRLRFRAEEFLNALFEAYKLVLAERNRPLGGTAQLLRVYRVLTLLPGQRRDYSLQEFARDLYLLEESGVQTTRDGHCVRFPSSTGTRTSGTLPTVVTRTGELRTYYGIVFVAP